MSAHPALADSEEYLALCNEESALVRRRDAINARLMEIQNRKARLCPIKSRHPAPTPCRRASDLPVPLPSSTALALKVMPNGDSIELPAPHGNGVELMVFAPTDRSAPPADGWHAPEVA